MLHRYTIHHGRSHLSEMHRECHGHLLHHTALLLCGHHTAPVDWYGVATTLRLSACMVLIALRAFSLSEAVRGSMLFRQHLPSEVLQSRRKFLGFHQLKGGVDLFEQLGILYTLRVGQLDGQALHADGFIGKNGVEAEIEEIGADVVGVEGGPIQEVHDEAAFGGTCCAHGLVDKEILALGQPSIGSLGQMGQHPGGVVGSALVGVEKQLKQFLLDVGLGQCFGIAAADST